MNRLAELVVDTRIAWAIVVVVALVTAFSLGLAGQLKQEDDVLRAKPDPCVAKYRAMSGAQRDQVASAMIMKLKWGKDRLAFIQ